MVQESQGIRMQESERVHRLRIRALMTALERNRSFGTPHPLLAADLAAECGWGGGHENRRRRVREMVAELHEQGTRICASSGRPEDCGYWLARSDAEWAAYQGAKRMHARFEFAKVRRMAEAAGEIATGQGKLFAVAGTDWARA